MDELCDLLAQNTLNEKDKDYIIVEEVTQEIIDFYENCCNEQDELSKKDNSGGQLRSKRGHMVEMIAEITMNALSKRINCKSVVECKKGSKDCIEIKSPNGFSKMHQTDRHCYLNNILTLVIECKSYLDSCYYERACMDAKIFKQHDNNISCIVLSLEDSLRYETKNFYDDIFDNCIDSVFYLCEGKRSSSKPIYKKEFKKMLNKDNVSMYVKYLLKHLRFHLVVDEE